MTQSEFGLKPQSKNSGIYSRLADSYVKVNLPGFFMVGYLKETNTDALYLNPHIMNESLENATRLRLESEKDGVIPAPMIHSVTPIRKEYVDEILEYNQKKNPLDNLTQLD